MRNLAVCILALGLARFGSAAEFVVTHVLDGGVGSLRAAIEGANGTPGTNTIRFDIPGAGVHTIAPLTALPSIAMPIVLDGFSQPGASPNSDPDGMNAVLKIEIDGRFVSPNGEVRAFRIATSNCLVRGLVINRFPGTAFAINAERRGNNVLTGNFIGCDPTGMFAATNGGGIYLRTPANRVGGPAPADRNLIVATTENGILISGPDAFANVVAGNFIGLNAAGSSTFGAANGIQIEGAAVNRIGGTQPGEGNVVAGYRSAPGAGVHLRGAGTVGNLVQGNRIGTDATGSQALGNGLGVLIQEEAADNLIGGTAAGAGNQISGNVGDGVQVRGAASMHNRIEGNLIGTDATGFGPLPNGRDGVRLQASFNRVGSDDLETAGNRIAFNLGRGVAVMGSTNHGNVIGRNSIFRNGGLGIDLEADGVTANDPLDADSGANRRQNFPGLTLAVAGGPGESLIAGSLSGAASRRLRIEAFASEETDPSGQGEGETFVGSMEVTTDADGDATFRLLPDRTLLPGQHITTTATDADGDTSEFSPALAAAPGIRLRVNGVAWTNAHAVLTNSATLELASGYPDARIFFTVDGSTPSSGAYFTGPFQVATTVVLRAIAYGDQFRLAAAIGPFTLELRLAPILEVQPEARRVLAGDDVALAGSARGSEPLRFLWLRDGQPRPGADRAVLSLPAVSAGDAGAYQLVVSNAWGASTSAVAVLTVVAPAEISEPPADALVAPGAAAQFCVSATGAGPLSYQWRRNGQYIAGATNDCLTLVNVGVGDGGSYSVVVANSLSATTSPPALLEIQAAERPGADFFAGRVALPDDRGSASGTNTLATREALEPLPANEPGGRSVWYTWRPTSSGLATVDTRGSPFDTLLAIYTGLSLETLAPVAADDDAGGYFTSLARFPVTAGMDYQITIDGLAGAFGRYRLNWEITPSGVDLPRIVIQPRSLATRPGAPAHFEITVAPETTGTLFQWYLNGRPADGATNRALSWTNVQAALLGTYFVRVGHSNAPGLSVDSAPASLEFGPETNVVSYDKLEDLLHFSRLPPGGGGGGLRPASTGPNGGSITVQLGVSDSQWFNNEGSRTQPKEQTHCGIRADGRTRWFYVVAATNANLILDTKGSGTNTLLAVYARNYDFVTQASDAWLSNNTVACAVDRSRQGAWVFIGNTNEVSGPFSPRQISAHRAPASVGSSNVTYLVVVDTLGAETNQSGSGLIRLNWRYGLPPVLVHTSGSRAVARGQAFTLQVLATNALAMGVSNTIAPPTYQWDFNGRLLEGASQTNLPLENIQFAQAGRYGVSARNDFGARSAAIRLAVFEAHDRLAASGQEAVLDATIAGDTMEPLEYRWTFAGRPIVGAGSLRLPIQRVTLTNAGHYGLTATTATGLSIEFSQHLAVAATFPIAIGDWALAPLRFGPVSEPQFSVVIEAAGDSTLGGPAWIPVATNDVTLQPPLRIDLGPLLDPSHAFLRARLSPLPPTP